MDRLDGVSDGGDTKSNGKDEVPFETGVEAVVGVAGRGGDVAVGGGDGGGAGGRRGSCWEREGGHFEFGSSCYGLVLYFCSEWCAVDSVLFDPGGGAFISPAD